LRSKRIHFARTPISDIMKKALRLIGWLVLAFLLLIALGASFIAIRGIPRHATQNPEIQVDTNNARVARGKKLASLLCQHCHLDPATGAFTGKIVADAPAEFGKAYAPNITASKAHGIGEWSDGQIAYLLRTGIKRDGGYAPPWMPKLPLMADEDLLSIIAFLRSGDPWVAAKEVPDQPCEPSFLTKFLCNIAFRPLPYPENPILLPDTADHVAHGRYLAVGAVECYSCHSADFKTIDPLVPENSIGFFGGGNRMVDMDGQTILTANITPDQETGIGKWTKEQFITAVMTGQRPDGRMLRAPMMPYVTLDSSEAGAIYEYLRTVPILRNPIATSN
jgi:mono/diheme cytochrome c family protein